MLGAAYSARCVVENVVHVATDAVPPSRSTQQISETHTDSAKGADCQEVLVAEAQSKP